MTIPQSLETLRIHVRNLEFANDRTYAEDPASGEVKLENPYANLIDALHVAIDCMELLHTRTESRRCNAAEREIGGERMNEVKQLNPAESAVALLRCLLNYHERVTMNDSCENGGLRCYSNALRLGIRCIEKTYGLPESDLNPLPRTGQCTSRR